MKLSEELMGIVNRVDLPISEFIVRNIALTQESFPGREAMGVLPLVIVGHTSMDDVSWRNWVRRVSVPVYGSGYTERILVHGIDIRELTAGRAMGRIMRDMAMDPQVFDRASTYVQEAIAAVEKWPSLSHALALADTGDMTLGSLFQYLNDLPIPQELGVPAGTLGSIIARNGTLTPNF